MFRDRPNRGVQVKSTGFGVSRTTVLQGFAREDTRDGMYYVSRSSHMSPEKRKATEVIRASSRLGMPNSEAAWAATPEAAEVLSSFGSGFLPYPLVHPCFCASVHPILILVLLVAPLDTPSCNSPSPSFSLASGTVFFSRAVCDAIGAILGPVELTRPATTA